MNNGLEIKRLIATGLTCDDASINFSSNAHVIIGPSNTGKSYVFQCLKYLLGSTKKPKKIKESYDYDDCYLEICLANKSTNTVRRSLSGGDALLYECSYAEIPDYTNEPESLIVGRKATKKNRTLNSYFLSVSDLKEREKVLYLLLVLCQCRVANLHVWRVLHCCYSSRVRQPLKHTILLFR